MKQWICIAPAFGRDIAQELAVEARSWTYRPLRLRLVRRSTLAPLYMRARLLRARAEALRESLWDTPWHQAGVDAATAAANACWDVRVEFKRRGLVPPPSSAKFADPKPFNR